MYIDVLKWGVYTAASCRLLRCVHSQALLQFDYTFPSTEEEEDLFQKSKLPCHLNLAACKLQQRDFEEVYIQCRLVSPAPTIY